VVGIHQIHGYSVVDAAMERIKFENVAGNYRFIVAWLENNIELANKHSTEMVAVPYHGSAVGQFAKYAGLNGLWHLEVRGTSTNITVEILDAKLAVQFALEHCYK